MGTKPYTHTRMIDQIHIPVPHGWRLEMELFDAPNISAQRERITILTQFSGPLPDHPQALELAALRRVHALLGEQILAMLSV
jgi:hypothetical protein